MLRFASSPTADMHIGNLRVALFNYIVSKQKKEDFIVRIEDTDTQKNIEGKDQETLDLLALFGIEYSQVIHQSQNVRFHSAMALQLVHERKAFSCFCSDGWLEKKQEEAKAANKAYSYDDACRNLPAELVIDNTSPFTIRVTRPDASVTIDDKIMGNVSFESDAVDSFVILHQDKRPTYDFSCGVDDLLNNISMVITTEENMSNTAKQIHIRESLKYDKKMEYAHLPHILNAEDFTVKSLLEEGYLPEAILNYLVSIGNSVPCEIFTTTEAIEWLDLSKVSTEPIVFDIEMLKHINKEHLKALDTKELSRYVGFADEEIGELARIYLEEAATTKELKSKILPIFEQRNIPKALSKQTTIMATAIKAAPYFEEYEDFKSHIMKETLLEGEEFEKSLRILLTNAEKGPEIAQVYKYLKNYIGEIVK